MAAFSCVRSESELCTVAVGKVILKDSSIETDSDDGILELRIYAEAQRRLQSRRSKSAIHQGGPSWRLLLQRPSRGRANNQDHMLLM
jgi:hypothetical protein